MAIGEIPFDFILENLYPLEINIKSMFGMKAIYHGDKILLMLRNTEKNPQANGIWVAVVKGQRDSLKIQIPALHTVTAYENKKSESEWQLLKPDHDNFESSAFEICELIKKSDPRIGRVPKKTSIRKSKKKS